MASFLSMYVPYLSFLIAERRHALPRGTHRLCFSAAAAPGGVAQKGHWLSWWWGYFFFYSILPRSLFFFGVTHPLSWQPIVTSEGSIQNQALRDPDAGSNLDAGIDEDASE